ncbi:MAG: hypothetical protein HOP96_01570 [Sphingomonas sp.]|nr:hypothetical protein [Sphingomonas sp.]
MKLELAMTIEQLAYHREREQRCREMAAGATDPDVRRRHEELANLHAGKAAPKLDSHP